MIPSAGSRIITVSEAKRGKLMKDYTSRKRLICLLQYMQKYTDPQHPVSTNELISILHDRYKIESDRNVIARDFDVLTKLCDIKVVRSSQNLYYYDGKLFSESDLRYLMDAVSSYRYITERESSRLTNKLETLSSHDAEEDLHRNVYVVGRAESRKEYNYRIVDVLNTAINRKMQVRFRYLNPSDCEKDPHYKGTVETMSPYALIWDGKYYYVIGYHALSDKVQKLRVDTIYNTPKILREQALPKPEGFSVDDYLKKDFYLYSAEKAQEITLMCDDSVVDDIFDQFGDSVSMSAIYYENRFTVKVTACPGPAFFTWIFSYSGAIRILAPSDVLEEYDSMLQKVQTEQKMAEDWTPLANPNQT